MQESLLQNIRKLFGILENIEKCVANSNAKDKAAKESTEKATSKGKHKGTNSNELNLQKGESWEKLYAVPETWGSAYGCHKYEKDGTPKQGFS